VLGPTKLSGTEALGLLHLEEKRVVVVAAHEERDVAAGAHAAYSHHLAGGMHVVELLEAMALAAQGPPIGGQQSLDLRGRILPLRARPWQVLDGHDQRRVGNDRQLPLNLAGPLGQHPGAVAVVSLR
jgi:hypothetical protein